MLLILFIISVALILNSCVNGKPSTYQFQGKTVKCMHAFANRCGVNLYGCEDGSKYICINNIKMIEEK